MDMDIRFLNVGHISSGYIAHSTITLCKETKLRQASQTEIVLLSSSVGCCLTKTQPTGLHGKIFWRCKCLKDSWHMCLKHENTCGIHTLTNIHIPSDIFPQFPQLFLHIKVFFELQTKCCNACLNFLINLCFYKSTADISRS